MGTIVVLIIILIIVFIFTREFWCWYWKINIRINQMDLLNENLEQIKSLLIHEISLKENTTNNKEEKLPEL